MEFDSTLVGQRDHLCDTISHMSHFICYGIGTSFSYFDRGTELAYFAIPESTMEEILRGNRLLTVVVADNVHKLSMRSGNLCNSRIFLQNLLTSPIFVEYMCVQGTVSINRSL